MEERVEDARGDQDEDEHLHDQGPRYLHPDEPREIGLNLAIYNIFDENPPVVGNEAGTTSANSGNTFPSLYDTLGTVYTAGFNYQF